MKEILLTSSVLILALLALRRAFRKKISRRLQYALWGLALLRLLIPANLPAADFSVLSAAAPVIREAGEQTLYIRPASETISAPEGTAPQLTAPSGYRFAAMGPPSSDNTRTVTDENQVTHQIEYERQIDLRDVFRPVWYGGMAVMTLWLLASNLGFWVKLRRRRIPLELPECRYPVYLVEEGLVSPCLFGLFRPAVYLTPAAMETKDSLRHVLAHEETHGRQKDPLWSLLRSVCLTVYWFDPLVWWAAAASREDCELACDEGALKRLGEDERIPYGQTLLRLIPVRRSIGGALVTATTMTSDKKRLKERITRIAENRKMKTAALCAALAVTAAVCAVTFTGYAAAEEPADAPDVPAAEGADAPEPAALPADREGILPSEAPALTVPLTELTPRGPLPVETVPAEELFTDHHRDGHHGEYAERYRAGGGCETTEGYGTFAWSYEGNIYVSSHRSALSSFPDDYFLTFPEQEYVEEAFTGLFGYDGVRISYLAEQSSGYYGMCNDYYVFTEAPEGGTNVFLLSRVYGEPQMIDLDGNGTLELASSDGWRNAQIVFQRDGQIFEADIGSLLREHWQEADYMELCGWEAGGRYLHLWSFIPAEGNAELWVTAWRRLYFDGESLLLYKRQRDLAEHMTTDIRAPAAVADAAREAARKELEDRQDNAYAEEANRPVWDDYCVTGLRPAYPTAEDQLPEGLNLAVYSLNVELHTSTPERVGLAGGVYVGEDGWVGGFGDGGAGYLVFQVREDGAYVYLDSLPGDADAGSPAFAEWTNDILAEHGLPQIAVVR